MSNDLVRVYDISGLVRAVEDLGRNQLELAGNVGRVAVTQDLTRSELADLRSRFEAFLQRDELLRNLDLAQTAKLDVGRELDNAFGHFADVRRQATGVLQALDAGIVTRRTIYQASEELMLNTPRYWLAPALVALAAWIRDDRRLAERALAEAVRRNTGKTSLFFTLVLRRHGRTAATSRWLQQYIVRQDPAALPREFTVVLDAVATGAFGPEARPIVLDHMTEWYERISADRSVVEAQVARWQQLVDNMRGSVDPRFTVLPAISSTWPTLKDLYERATVFGRAESFFRGIFDGPVPLSDDLSRRVDDILTSLVTNFDEEEGPLRRKMDELQAIIDSGGDKEAAARALKAAEPLQDERADLLTLLTNAAFYPDKVGASKGTQRLAVVLAREWIIEAGGRLEAANIKEFPKTVDLAVDGWTGRIDSSSTEEQLTRSIVEYVDGETERAVAQVPLGGPAVLAIGIGVAALVFAIVSAAGGSVGSAVFFLLVVVACGGWAVIQFQRREQRRRQVREQGEQRKAIAGAQIKGAIAEATDWRDAWQREMDKAEPFRRFMAGLVRDAHVGSSPGQPREVLAQ